MGNSINCIDCDTYSRQSQKEREQFQNYSELPKILKLQELQRHNKFKHGPILRNTKASIADQLKQESLRQNEFSYRTTYKNRVNQSDQHSCSCKPEEFHRLISIDGNSDDENFLSNHQNSKEQPFDDIFNKDFHPQVFQNKYNVGFTRGTNTDQSGSPFSKSVITDGAFSFMDDEVLDFCIQCIKCSSNNQKGGQSQEQQQDVIAQLQRKISQSEESSEHQQCQEDDESVVMCSKKNHVHHTHLDHVIFEGQQQDQGRRDELQFKQRERQNTMFKEHEYNLTRKLIICKISSIIHLLIKQFMEKVLDKNDMGESQLLQQSSCQEIRQSSLLFNEQQYIKSTQRVRQAALPKYMQIMRKDSFRNIVEDLEKAPTQKTIEVFIKSIIKRMKLTNEVCLLSLIFIERLIKKGSVQILSFNWRPIVYTSILLAAKFWEDILFWNIDFVEGIELYPLKSINQLESTFLALCDYELYVSEELYNQYYDTLITKTKNQQCCNKEEEDFHYHDYDFQ